MSSVVVVLALSGCGAQPPSETRSVSAADQTEVFIDRAEASGLDFSYSNGMDGHSYLLEVMGGGVAVFDYDNDGDLDIFAVQGRSLAEGASTEGSRNTNGGGRLFRNDLKPGRDGVPRLEFTDTTEESGLRAFGYGMGVTAGDYDGDGWVDLYVTNWGANELWRNNGRNAEGTVTFSDMTLRAGATDDHWSVAAVFFDYDRDGALDLYIGNYVEFTLATHKVCIGFGASEDYCGPAAYPAQPDRLLRNMGRGPDGQVTFADVTAEAGLYRELGPALGAVAADFNLDGWIDLYVANDQNENFLWINEGARAEHSSGETGSSGQVSFTNRALLAGVALNGEGKVEASMGVDAGDFDGDGDLDLFLTHLTGESHTLYVNDGLGNFDDATVRSGLSAPSWGVTGFGARFLDYDLDGWLDLVVTAGAVHRIEEQRLHGEPYPLRQPNQLFRNLGDGTFEDVSGISGLDFGKGLEPGAGPTSEPGEVSRGAAVGDLDNDGDPDVVLINSNGPLRLLVNSLNTGRRWLGLRLLDPESESDMLASTVALRLPGRPPLLRRAGVDGSYASASDPRVLFGLGDMSEVERLEVRWPDGTIETWTGLALNQYITLRRGEGRESQDSGRQVE